jgi:predicted O-methyltransferase YrrM
MKMDVDGDTFLWAEIEGLVKKHDIEMIVETGTYLGNTAKKFSTLADVITCEVNREHYDSAVKNIEGNRKILALFGNSVDMLRKNADKFKNKRVLFFLDAHWYDYCPLLDELKLIADLKMQPIIVIHDFKVPGKDFGFDPYRGRAFDYALIELHLRAIYGNHYGKEGFSHYYNTESDGPRRGCIFIVPRKEMK